MNRKVEIMFDKENRQREAKKRLKEKQLALVNGSKKMVVVGATTLVLAGAFSCSQASAYDRYDDNSYRGIGYMCFSDEVGSDGDGSYVSPGTGDYGGISYGLYQFSTTTGSAKDFVNWSKDSDYPEIYKIFQDAGNPKAGTPAFGKAWKKCYRELEGKFEEAQTEFAMGELINPGYEKVKKETGIDLKKSRARTEFLISTANQFGRGGIVTLFKEVQNKGIKLSDDMSDTELLGIMCQHKYDTVDYHFRSSSSAVQRSARLRFKREKKELLKIAKEEEGPKLDEIDTNKEQTEATKTETSSSKTSKKEVVNDTADKYQGKGITYDFGEKNYKSGSLDCSGLISQMMNDMGVKVDAGNTNALAFSNNSKKISKDEVQPGDLVFWNDDNGSRHNSVYHIGMYVGNDTIVDCSPSHNGVGTRKLSQCKDTGDMHYTYGRYTKLENKMKDYAQKIVESIDEFDDVITVDDSNIEKDYKKVEEKTTELKEAINENAKEDNNQKEESSKEDKSEESSKEDREDNKEDNNVQEENKKDNETSLDKSEDASNKDEFESIIDEDKTDKSEETSKEENNQKEESSNENKEEETSKEDKTEESSEDKEETNDSTLDKTLVVGDSHAKALEDKLKDNKDTEVEATVGASAYVYLNDTNYFGDKLIDKLPKDSDKINKVIISLGVNNIEGNSNINDVKKVIDKIESMYPGKDIYFMKVNHVGDKYKDGDVDKTNKMIDDLNKEIENYVKDKDKVKVIDASKGLENKGKLTETSDGLHVKDNDKLIDNLEKGIEENKKDNETSLDKSEDASNKDEFESIIDEDKTDKSEETSKEENNQKEESEETSKEDKEEEPTVEKEETSKEEDKSNENNQKEESSKEDKSEETSKEDNNVQEENNQKEETTESSKENKSEESSKEEDVVDKQESTKESSKEDNNVQEENNQKEETTESSKEEEPLVEKEESSKEDKSEETSKEDNNVQESTKETSNEDKEENVVKEQKETSKEEAKSEVKQTVQDKSNESSKEEKPVVEEQKSVNTNQESATETSKEDNSESQKENSRVDELHSRLQNNLFGRILMS